MLHTAHRILLINHYAGSPHHGMEYRPFYFAREWARAGHRVLIVAASFSHLRQENPIVNATLTRENIEGVEYLWVRTPQYSGNGASRARNMLAFTGRLYSACREPISELRPDLVIASSTYTWDNWPAAYYARKYGARYVYELHDVWPESPMELANMSKWHPFIWSLQRAEDFACRSADLVVSLLPAVQPHLTEHGLPPDRFVCIPNGIVAEEWACRQDVPEEHAEAIRNFRKDFRCLVGYVGGHNFSDPLELLIAAGADPAMKDVGIVCVGNGPKKAKLEHMGAALHSRVLFLPTVAKACVPALLGLFDILFIGWSRSPLYRFGISPNKLYEYMMAGIPILHSVEAANDPVQDAACGVSVLPEDVSSICAGIRQLADLPIEQRRAMGERGRRYVEEHHMVNALAQRFLEEAYKDIEE